MTACRLSLAVLLLGGAPVVVAGQPSEASVAGDSLTAVQQRVTEAFAEGAPRDLLSPAAERIELSLLGVRSFYSSAQAFYVLRDFFETHPPRRFRVENVTTTGDSCFITGRYGHARGERMLQVYVRLVLRPERSWILHEVRIENRIE
jgi:hypothetical protein